MRVPSPLRAAALRVAPLARLVAQRDQLVRENECLVQERDALTAELALARRDHRFVPPGHFYSPIPALDEIERDAVRLFPTPPPRTIPSIELNEPAQMAFLERSIPFYREMPFQPEAQPGLRFRFENGAFSYADAIFLYLMLRRLQPRRVIEVGSGFSSCVTLDTSERFLANAVDTVFIEPYPDLLRSLLHPGDAERITLVPTRLQDVPLDLFRKLGANDILFIDSTHVGKVGSDVLYVFNEILPVLAPGVYVHFHDIFYPFEYPRYWFDEGRAWNEAYLLRSFLQYNTAYRVDCWNHFLLSFHAEFFARHMPLCLRNTGASLWLQRQ